MGKRWEVTQHQCEERKKKVQVSIAEKKCFPRTPSGCLSFIPLSEQNATFPRDQTLHLAGKLCGYRAQSIPPSPHDNITTVSKSNPADMYPFCQSTRKEEGDTWSGQTMCFSFLSISHSPGGFRRRKSNFPPTLGEYYFSICKTNLI